MPYVVGSLGSRPARSKGLGNRKTTGNARREPRGTRHAVDAETGEAACGMATGLQVFDFLPWAPEDEWCDACEELVPFDH